MPVSRFEILSREPYENGRAFGDTGPYERIEAIAHYAVDPDHDANQGVVDLELAERGADGLVHFSGDVTLLRPISGGSRTLLMQVPNRGKRNITRFNMTVMSTTDTVEIAPGDGFLFNNGLTVAWAGWQWDVPRTPEHLRLGLAPPQVPLAARTPPSQMQLRLQINADGDGISLTDHHVGALGMHEPISPADMHDPGARLLVRDGAYGEPAEISRAQWRFEPDDHVHLEGGFAAGRIYDLLYTPRDCPVVGAGMLATRDLAAFLRHDGEAPTANSIDYVVAEGQSQCGRFLRTLLHLGLNLDEAGRPAFDGVLVHIAGGRRGEFNHRYGQPSVQPTPSFGHLFPFADLPQTDPISGNTAGLLDRQTTKGGLPKIIYTDTSSEYWRGDAGLSHGDLATDGDAALPGGVRRYLFGSTQHGAGVAKFADRTMFGSHGQNHLNIVDYRPLYRAALMNLAAWVRDGTPPPASAYPMADRRGRRAEVMAALSNIPGLALPNPDVMTAVYPMDLGTDAGRGIGAMPPVLAAEAYPDWVSRVDESGNETGGIPMPDITVPVATHTGFNPRHGDTGGAGQLLEYVGSTIPLARDQAARLANGDPRPALGERYDGRDDYLHKVRRAAEDLVERRYLLAGDVELCIDIAAVRYDACLAR
ncbi:MAG: alpha/beta hydrolase domain-containing protein [Alphaproteobacteria bacterium]